jgi:D-ribulokinase
MADIEKEAYDLMTSLGASPVEHVFTAGGGAHNPVWTALRGKALRVPVSASPHGALL